MLVLQNHLAFGGVKGLIEINVLRSKWALATIPHASEMRRHGQIKRRTLRHSNPKIGTAAGARTPRFDNASDNALNLPLI